MPRADIDRAREALQFISPDLPHDEWVRIGMACLDAGLQFDDFDNWSASASSYSKRATGEAWRSFKPGKGVSAGTLFKAAKEHGWSDSRESSHAQSSQVFRRPAHRATPSHRGMSPAEVWQRCAPASAEHGYIVAKAGTPDGLRVLPDSDPLTIAGQRMAGALVVPVWRLDGVLSSLHFIPPPGDGRKLSLPGAPIDGMFTVGEMQLGAIAYLCEGIGQAWACCKATGYAAVVCFGWGRVRAVAHQLRERDKSAQLVIVPDVGKESEAEAIAREVRGSCVFMPAGWERNADVNDFAQREGVDALDALLSAPHAPPQRFRLLGSADLHALPPLTWCVRGVLPAQGLAAVYGPSGSGKSFLVLDAAASIAEGAPWFGYRAKATPVVYCALDGEAGFRLRVAAWEQGNGCALPAGLHLMLQPFKLTDSRDVEDLAAAVLSAGAGAVTILDTLNRAAPEADENASTDMGRILEAAKMLQRLTGGLVVVVHHTGKDATRGLRGHSSLFAALDAAVEVTREGDRREWKVAKAKDGQDGAGHPFRLEVVDLGEDGDGEAVTSCVIAPDESPQDKTRCRLPKGGNQKVVLDALGELLRNSATFGRAGAPPARPCVQLESAVEAIAPRLIVAPKRQKERLRQALRGLTASGDVTCREGWLWLP